MLTIDQEQEIRTKNYDKEPKTTKPREPLKTKTSNECQGQTEPEKERRMEDLNSGPNVMF